MDRLTAKYRKKYPDVDPLEANELLAAERERMIIRCIERPHRVSGIKRCYWFRRCFASGKQLFLKPCVLVILRYDGPGSPVYVYAYFDAREYLLCQLKY